VAVSCGTLAQSTVERPRTRDDRARRGRRYVVSAFRRAHRGSPERLSRWELPRALEGLRASLEVEEATADDFTRLTTRLQLGTYSLLVDATADLPAELDAVLAYQRRGFVSLNLSFVSHALFAILVSAIERGMLTRSC